VSDIEEAQLRIKSGESVSLEEHSIKVAVPIGGEKIWDEIGIQKDYEWTLYRYVNGLQPIMQVISKLKKKPTNQDYVIKAIVDVRRKVIKKIIEFDTQDNL
jgi:hypothetical protein